MKKGKESGCRTVISYEDHSLVIFDCGDFEAGDDDVIVLRVHSLLSIVPHRVAMATVSTDMHSGETGTDSLSTSH